jgi:hypothetical protein
MDLPADVLVPRWSLVLRPLAAVVTASIRCMAVKVLKELDFIVV